jgi:hypothetical protein
MLLFGKLVECGLDEVTFQMVHVFDPVLIGGVLGWVEYSLYSDGKRSRSRKGFNVGVHKGRKRR